MSKGPCSAKVLSAQRLSASTNGSHAYVLTARSRRPLCSTPFGINEWFTDRREDYVICRYFVLNAFRHQRMVHLDWGKLSTAQLIECSTPFGINEWFTFALLSATASGQSCSTPFGINEWFTGIMQGQHLLMAVLNAFRHQRMVHPGEKQSSVADKQCSTPFGINEWFTGSKKTPEKGCWWCSTPFGINEWFTVRHARTGSSVRMSAQRLSASTNGSRRSL